MCKSDHQTLCSQPSGRLTALLFLAVCAQIVGCGGGSGTVSVSPPPPPTIDSVTVACSPKAILTVGTSTCTANVTGTGSYSSAVTWSVSPTSVGSVSSTGVFTPSSTGTATITATSTQDTTKSGSAPINVPSWKVLEPMSGGYIGSLVVDQGHTAFASTASTRVGRPAGTPGIDPAVVKTKDHGTTWVSAQGDLPAPISGPFVADPVSPGVLYAWTSLGLYKTTNEGTNWTKLGLNLTAGNSALHIAIAPTNPNRIYVSTSGASAQCSTDGGNTFIKCSNGLYGGSSGPDYVVPMAVNPANELVAYTATYRGLLFKTADGGANWQAIANTPNVGNANQIYIAPSNPNVLYLLASEGYNLGTVEKSVDGGSTWTDAGIPDGVAGDAAQLQILPSDPNTVYATTSMGLYATTTGGGAWNLVFPLPPAVPINVVSVALDSQNSVIYVGSASNGVYVSTDSGSTWQQKNQNIFQVRVVGLDVCSSAPNTVYALASGQVPLKTVDSGTTWSQIGAALFNNHGTSSLACSPTDASHLLVSTVSSSGAGYVNPAGNIWISNDGGLTFNTASVSVQNAQAGVFAFNPKAPSLVNASLPDWQGGFLSSVDGGSTWTQPYGIYTYPGDYAYHPVLANVVFTVTSTYVFSTFDNVGIAYSVDSGATWNPSPVGQGYFSHVALDQGDPTTLYVVGTIPPEQSSGVYKFKVVYNGNQISSLTRIPGTFNTGLTDPADIRQLLFNAATGYVYAATATGIFRSKDGAATWITVNQDLVHTDIYHIAISPDGTHLYAGTNAGIYELDVP